MEQGAVVALSFFAVVVLIVVIVAVAVVASVSGVETRSGEGENE